MRRNIVYSCTDNDHENEGSTPSNKTIFTGDKWTCLWKSCTWLQAETNLWRYTWAGSSLLIVKNFKYSCLGILGIHNPHSSLFSSHFHVQFYYLSSVNQGWHHRSLITLVNFGVPITYHLFEKCFPGTSDCSNDTGSSLAENRQNM